MMMHADVRRSSQYVSWCCFLATKFLSSDFTVELSLVASLSQIVGVGHDWWEKVMDNIILMIQYHLSLAETWSEVWGGRGRRVSAEKFFCRPLQNVKFGGAAGDSLYSRITIFNPWILCIYSGFRGF